MRRSRPALLALFLLAAPLGAAADEAAYLSDGDVPLTELLAPPPAPGSPRHQIDMQAVLDAQTARTETSVEQAKADSLRSVMRFADALGPGAIEAALPLTRALFRRVAKETEDLTDLAKALYQRPRPFKTNPDIHPLLVTPADGSRPTGRTPSYPSGHSAFATATAILLSAMVPERKAEIFQRAEIFAQNRLVAGVHYPSDIEAGRISGTVIANALMHSDRFRSDYAPARAELRRALGLDG